MSIIERPHAPRVLQMPVRMSVVVAVPVHNEQDKIAACLEAFADQTGILPGSLGLLLFLNNCTDGTRAIVESFSSDCTLPVRVLDEDFPAATAGWARRRAMDAAADWLEHMAAVPDAALLTSDADSRVGADWVARNLAALAEGADAVAGRFLLQPDEFAALPHELRTRISREAAYEALLAEIDARLDPQPGNPWPSHWTTSGASIAVRLDTYRRIDGLPRCDCGEDRALIEAIRAKGYLVRHDPDIVVVTSCRRVGRARGGVADTLELWGNIAESPCDPRLGRLEQVVTRTLRRRWHRRLSRVVPRERPFRPLRPSQLPRQIYRARVLVGLIRYVTRRRTSRRYAAVRMPRKLVDQLRAVRKKWSAASSPVKG